jgi:hypothetical protein
MEQSDIKERKGGTDTRLTRLEQSGGLFGLYESAKAAPPSFGHLIRSQKISDVGGSNSPNADIQLRNANAVDL